MRERARTECSGHNMPHLIAIPIPQRGPAPVEPNSLSANYLALTGGPPISWIGVSWTVVGTSRPFHGTVGEGTLRRGREFATGLRAGPGSGARVLRAFMWEIGVHDPTTFTGSVVVLVVSRYLCKRG